MESIFQPLPRLHTTSTLCNISQHAVYHLMGMHLENENGPAFIPGRLNNSAPSFETEIELEHCANGVVHPITKETITKYEKLANDPITQEVWTKAMTK